MTHRPCFVWLGERFRSSFIGSYSIKFGSTAVNIFWRSCVSMVLWWAARYWNRMKVNQYCIDRAQITITLCPGNAWTYQLSLAVQGNRYLGAELYPRKSANACLCLWIGLHDSRFFRIHNKSFWVLIVNLNFPFLLLSPLLSDPNMGYISWCHNCLKPHINEMLPSQNPLERWSFFLFLVL